MLGIGVIEGFFGPEWSWSARHHFCENLKSYGGSFYIYAPKRDSYLRKNWTQPHPESLWKELQTLSAKCVQSQIAFGVGLSPFEIHDHWNETTKNQLKNKINHLSELNFQYLGLFFDDMKGSADLAAKQIEIVDYVQSLTDQKILFCPTYYSFDPILDKVFGQRAENYLEQIGTLSKNVEIFWTGNKVIPQSITSQDLEEVSQILKRKPVIWENYFANDGPKQCKFLKLKPFEGRSEAVLKSSAGWAFNLMNQPGLSELLFASSVQVLKGADPRSAFEKEISRMDNADFVKSHLSSFLEKGLDGIDEKEKTDLQKSISHHGVSSEIQDWLQGKYIVGPECLTD